MVLQGAAVVFLILNASGNLHRTGVLLGLALVAWYPLRFYRGTRFAHDLDPRLLIASSGQIGATLVSVVGLSAALGFCVGAFDVLSHSGQVLVRVLTLMVAFGYVVFLAMAAVLTSTRVTYTADRLRSDVLSRAGYEEGSAY